jgi:probable HAF family extracellular repeat protein
MTARPLQWPASPATDLGTFSGAYEINDYDWVVGWAEQTNGGDLRAFVHDGTRMTDLNSFLWNGRSLGSSWRPSAIRRTAKSPSPAIAARILSFAGVPGSLGALLPTAEPRRQMSYRGSSGNCAAPAGTRIPFSFRLVQIWTALDASTGTSKAPALILTVSDGCARSCHRREPQSAQ